MTKTCGVCNTGSYEVGFEDGKVFERWRCRETGLVHERDHQCDAPESPRLCDVLGVKVGEHFRVRTGGSQTMTGSLCVLRDGSLVAEEVDTNAALWAMITAINHPEKVDHLPGMTLDNMHLTPEEVQRCRDFGAKWVSRDLDSNQVWLWETRPRLQPEGVWNGGESCGQAWDRFFPSVQPGQLVRVEAES